MPKVKSRKKLRFDRFKFLRDDGAGFASTNKVTFIDKNFNIEPMELKSKEAVADDILNKVIANFYE
jgi:phosphopantothenoylcysteine decarboxylase/phosphopantothenate--cysteine ligase